MRAVEVHMTIPDTEKPNMDENDAPQGGPDMDSEINPGGLEKASDDLNDLDVEVLPPAPLKKATKQKKDIGFGTLLTCIVLASLLGASGGFGLSYFLIPKLVPAVDQSVLEIRLADIQKENEMATRQILKLQDRVEKGSNPDSVTGLSDVDFALIEARIATLETNPEGAIAENVTLEQFEVLQRKVEALTAFESKDGEAVPVEIARRLERLETSESPQVLSSADPTTFMYGDRLLRDILQEILENQISLQTSVENTSDKIVSLEDETAAAIAKGASVWPEGANEPESVRDLGNSNGDVSQGASAVIGAMANTDPKVQSQDGTENQRSQEIPSNDFPPERENVPLPEFPEMEVRAALRQQELSGKNWLGRLIGQNISIKTPGTIDAVDEVIALIALEDISGAIEKIDELPSPVRSVAKEWTSAARRNISK